MSKEICQEISNILKERMKDDSAYINPHFMCEVTWLMEEYYNFEDDELHRMIHDMFGH